MQHQSSKSGTTITARVFDPAPPNHTLIWLAMMFVGGVIGAFTPVPATGLAALAAVFLALVWDTRWRRGVRQRRITCKPGSLQIPRSGLIRAADLEGATTARFGDRISLVLAHRRRRRAPIVLDLPDEAALMTICKALGIGHHGFGHFDFVVQPPTSTRLRYWANGLTLLSFAAAWIPPLTAPALGVLSFAAMASAIIALTRIGAFPRVVRLTSGGVFVPGVIQPDFLPFRAIDEVTLEPDAIVFRIESTSGTIRRRVPIKSTSWSPQGASRGELEHFVAQIRAASERAHGKFLLKSSPQTLAQQLARGEKELVGDWHARLDTLGIGGGYRGTTVEPQELWTLFEDPDALPDVRVAAARVLRRIARDEIRVRVADVLATVRDETTRARIAASLEDVDAAEEAALVHSAHS
jgi:hypothetical protein